MSSVRAGAVRLESSAESVRRGDALGDSVDSRAGVYVWCESVLSCWDYADRGGCERMSEADELAAELSDIIMALENYWSKEDIIDFVRSQLG